MDNVDKYMKLEADVRKTTDAWLANDSAENFAAMMAADDVLAAAKAAGWNIIRMAPEVAEQVWNNSAIGQIFSAEDARRAARV